MPRHILAGSERKPLPGAKSLGKADLSERFEVSVLVRRGAPKVFKESVKKLAARRTPAARMKREEFAKQFGADAKDIAAVKKFARSHGLVVVQSDQPRRTVILSGTVVQFDGAFGVDLQQFEHDGGTYRGRIGAIHLPKELSGIVQGVFGLDNRPAAKPHFRIPPPLGNVQWSVPGAAATSFYPTQLASLYDFPSGTGEGECIGIIELGGGYRPADLNTYFSELKIAEPKITAISVDHATNHPTGVADGPDGEVMLDIEVSGAIAPGANIAVYFAPNTDAGFLDAITTAIHDTVNRPSVISISWGSAESSWSQQAMTAFDEAFQAAAVIGITICVAAGDNGSTDGVSDGKDHVDFPASSSYALACGGTSLAASGGKITSEVVWNDGAKGGAGGGGVSTFFALPAWQQGLQVTNSKGIKSALKMRGVPDVSGDADPQTGYDVRVDGSNTVFGGTSAVAPLWAGLIALINASKGSSVGYLQPLLYQNPASLHDITQGNNGDFAASAGWDACSGLGSPDGQKIAGIV